jgi:hypothetical protein
MIPDELIVLVCLMPVFWFSLVVVSRAVVKNDLRDRTCQPISVRWQSLASSRSRCVFKVVYSDFQGKIHHASCETNWYGGALVWFDDEVVG